MVANGRLPLRLLARKPVRLGGRTYGSGSPIRWRDIGLTERKAGQLVRLGYLEDPLKKPRQEPCLEEPRLEDLSLKELRELLPEDAKAGSKKRAIELILAVAVEPVEPEIESEE